MTAALALLERADMPLCPERAPPPLVVEEPAHEPKPETPAERDGEADAPSRCWQKMARST